MARAQISLNIHTLRSGTHKYMTKETIKPKFNVMVPQTLLNGHARQRLSITQQLTLVNTYCLATNLSFGRTGNLRI